MKKKHLLSLSMRSTVALNSIIVIGMLCIGIFTFWLFYNISYQAKISEGQVLVKTLSKLSGDYMSANTLSPISTIVRNSLLKEKVSFSAIINTDFSIIAEKMSSELPLSTQSVLIMIQKHNFKTTPLYSFSHEEIADLYIFSYPVYFSIETDDTEYTFEEKTSVIVDESQRIIGYSIIGLSTTSIQNNVAAVTLKFIASLVLVLCIIAIFITVFIHKLLSPITSLSENLKDIETHQPSEIPLSSVLEFDEIIHQINLILSQSQHSIEQLEGADRKIEIKVLERTGELELKSVQLEESLEKAKEADRLKSEFLANMSHELRTPLNAIIGFSEVLMQGLDGQINEAQQNDIQLINLSGAHLLTLINTILDMAKIESGKMELYYTTINIESIVDEVLSISKALIKDKPLSLEKDLSLEISVIEADLTKLKQILINIISNSIKFTEKGSVIILTRPADKFLEFEIKDTGIGIRKEDIPLVFEQFRQIDGSLTRETGGTGLGMPLVKQLVELQNGEIWLNSTPGKGTSVLFTLPIKPKK